LNNSVEINRRIPPNFDLAGHWQFRIKASSLIVLVAGGILVFALSFILGIIIRGLFRGTWEGQIAIQGLGFFPIFLGAVAAVVVLHEAIHGLLFLILGGGPHFGFKLIGKFFPVAYATSSVPLLRDRYLLVGLGPSLVLTPIFLVLTVLANNDGLVVLTLMVMALNMSGSIADFVSACNMLRHDRKTLFEDTQEGFKWYVPSARTLNK
jgi:hypothetical protein